MRKPRKMTKPEAASLGGIARKAKLSPKRRKEIARNAALVRWGPARLAAQRFTEGVARMTAGKPRSESPRHAAE